MEFDPSGKVRLNLILKDFDQNIIFVGSLRSITHTNKKLRELELTQTFFEYPGIT